jgi:hypothetical protein
MSVSSWAVGEETGGVEFALRSRQTLGVASLYALGGVASPAGCAIGIPTCAAPNPWFGRAIRAARGSITFSSVPHRRAGFAALAATYALPLTCPTRERA